MSDVRRGNWLRGRLEHGTGGMLVVVLLGTIARLPMLPSLLPNRHRFRQTQTASAVREYARDGIDLFHPPMVVLGPPWAVPLEFPLFQAMATPLVWLGLSSSTAARVMALVCFQATAVLLFFLVRRWGSTRAAVIAVVLFEATPFGVLWATASLIEYLATALILASVLALDLWFREGGNRWLAVTAACSSLGFLTKVTTGAAWVWPLAAVAVVFVVRSGWRTTWRRGLLGLLAAPGAGLVCAAAWTAYSDAQKELSPFTRFLTSGNLAEHNFGTLAQRLTGSTWLAVLGRVEEVLTGPWPALVAVLVLVALARRSPLFMISLVLVPVTAVAVFFNLYLVHDYYLAAVVPAVAALMGVGIDELARRFPLTQPAQAAVAAVAVVAVLGATFRSPLAQQYQEVRDNAPVPLASQLLAQTPRDSRILALGCGFSPTTFYFADRRGLMYVPERQGEGLLTPQVVAEYDYLMVCRAGGRRRRDLFGHLPDSVKIKRLFKNRPGTADPAGGMAPTVDIYGLS